MASLLIFKAMLIENKNVSGSSMTDGSPLLSIRKSLARVKAEIVGMDVRVRIQW